jgi:glutamate dehydrogenase (NAD(P)+)
VGGWAAELLALYGGKVIAVSDNSSAIFNPNGLDVLALKQHLRARPPFGGHLGSFPGGARSLRVQTLPKL